MKNNIDVKIAQTQEDAAKIAKIAAAIWTEYYTPIIGTAQVEYMLNHIQSETIIYNDFSSGGYTYYMPYVERKLAGYAAVKPDFSEKTLFLSKLYVDKAFRNCGVAKHLLSMLTEKCRCAHYSSIWLTVNKNNSGSIAVYKKLGFKIAKDLDTDIGGGFVMDDYKMVLNLS
jgi:ribosomal protein S18 acetylase RimI-like enzyme